MHYGGGRPTFRMSASPGADGRNFAEQLLGSPDYSFEAASLLLSAVSAGRPMNIYPVPQIVFRNRG